MHKNNTKDNIVEKKQHINTIKGPLNIKIKEERDAYIKQKFTKVPQLNIPNIQECMDNLDRGFITKRKLYTTTWR